MKKHVIFGILSASLLYVSCAVTNTVSKTQSYKTASAGMVVFENVDYDKDSVLYEKKVDDFENVTIINYAKSKGRNPVNVDLSEFADTEVFVEFSCDLKVVDKTGAQNDIIWMINEMNNGFPELARKKVESDKWNHFAGNATVALSGPRQFYISGAGIEKENVTFYIKNFRLKVSGESIGVEKVPQKSWKDEPSLAEAYAPYFDYFGLCGPKNGVMDNSDVMEGLAHQASCFTMENEFKPDFTFAWQKPALLRDFTGENGKIIQVPGNTPVVDNIGSILRLAKYMGIKMRGHVLVWHSQTPDWFFRENYGSNKEALVDKDTMNARMEWYIKTILEYITDWENKNNNGEHIVITWDVVNEAASDNATQKVWLRTQSNWFQVYQSDEFIVNAFRYANKYAPKDVLLAYNDYGCASPTKCAAICKIVDAIQAAPDARIDVVGMQTHVGMNTPVTGPNSFETSLQTFASKGVDVQITEMDIGLDGQKYNSERQKAKYKEFFTMFLNNRKTSEKHGVRGVTLWGIIDERSWISNNGGTKQHPLLFDGDYTCKPAFYGVLEAAQEFGNE